MRDEEIRVAAEGESLRGSVTTGERIRALIIVFFVEVVCALAFYFELHRAESGNALSWAYVFEWPILGVVAIFMMWKFTHPETIRAPKRDKPLEPEFESMRHAWEESQARLAATRQDDASGEPA